LLIEDIFYRNLFPYEAVYAKLFEVLNVLLTSRRLVIKSVDNIKIDLVGTGWKDLDWSDLTQDGDQ
jgi:hypothetical protein